MSGYPQLIALRAGELLNFINSLISHITSLVPIPSLMPERYVAEFARIRTASVGDTKLNSGEFSYESPSGDIVFDSDQVQNLVNHRYNAPMILTNQTISVTWRTALTIMVTAWWAGSAGAQPNAAENDVLTRILLSGESSRTARRLAAADKLVSQEKWADAIEEYQRILAEASNDLVPIDGRHDLAARRLCHLRIAALPPSALRTYRSRVDTQAKKLLDQAKAGYDAVLLRRIVEESFCSRPAEQAIDSLGDLAFERGISMVQSAGGKCWPGLLAKKETPRDCATSFVIRSRRSTWLACAPSRFLPCSSWAIAALFKKN